MKGNMHMNKRALVLNYVLDTLGVPVAVETYDQRKRIQWTVYLLQRLGHNLAYHFRGSMTGIPYCKELLADVENIIMNNHIDPGWTSKWEMNNSMKASIQQAKLRWEKPESLNIDEMQWLDLLVRWDWGLNKQGLNEILVANDIINRVQVPWNAVLAALQRIRSWQEEPVAEAAARAS